MFLIGFKADGIKTKKWTTPHHSQSLLRERWIWEVDGVEDCLPFPPLFIQWGKGEGPPLELWTLFSVLSQHAVLFRLAPSSTEMKKKTPHYHYPSLLDLLLRTVGSPAHTIVCVHSHQQKVEGSCFLSPFLVVGLCIKAHGGQTLPCCRGPCMWPL